MYKPQSRFLVSTFYFSFVLLTIALIVIGGAAGAQTTVLESVASDGTQGNSDSASPSITPDGRYVVFRSTASNLIAGTGSTSNVFWHDRVTGETKLVSQSTGGLFGNNDSSVVLSSAVSADGRYVVFSSRASNFAANDNNGKEDVFLRDMTLGTTTRVSLNTNGGDADNDSTGPHISGNGQWILFTSYATNLVSTDTDGTADVFLYYVSIGTTSAVSPTTGTPPANGQAFGTDISFNGSFIVFYSLRSDIMPPGVDTNSAYDVFLVNTGVSLSRVSVSTSGAQGNGGSVGGALSDNGRFVCFTSGASNLVTGDMNGVDDIFVRDTANGTTLRVSVSTTGGEANGLSNGLPDISADGHAIAFASTATNLVLGDTNGLLDIFVHDIALGTTTRVNVSSGGVEAMGGDSGHGCLANTGVIAMESGATNLVAFDANGILGDIFSRTGTLPAGSMFCAGDGIDPAVTTACPCGNFGALGRGCANSVNSSGAVLMAQGNPSVTADTVTLFASGMPATVGCEFFQGDMLAASGIVFGDGVRCADGILIRLGAKTASGGAAAFGYLQSGDPAVSVKGMVPAGSQRWYQTFYRNASTTFCPPETFNVTNGYSLAWGP